MTSAAPATGCCGKAWSWPSRSPTTTRAARRWPRRPGTTWRTGANRPRAHHPESDTQGGPGTWASAGREGSPSPGATDGNVRVWDPATGQGSASRWFNGAPVWAIVTTPPAALPVQRRRRRAPGRSASQGDPKKPGTFAPAGRPIRTATRSLTFSCLRTGRRCAPRRRDGPLVLFAFDGALTSVATLGEGAGVSACFSPDSKTVYYATASGDVNAYHIPDALGPRPVEARRTLTATGRLAGRRRLAVATFDPTAKGLRRPHLGM